MAKLRRGQIVWQELTDPQGRNPTVRPAVVVTPDADIRDDGEVWLVAISRQHHLAPAELPRPISLVPSGRRVVTRHRGR